MSNKNKNLNDAGAVILTLPDNSRKEFNSGQEAQQWMNENGYSSYVWAKDNTPEQEIVNEKPMEHNTSLLSSPQFQDVFGFGNPIWGSSRTNLWTKPIGTKYYNETETYQNFKDANDAVARTITNLFLAPTMIEGVAGIPNIVKGLWNGGKELLGMWRFNPVHGAYETAKISIPFATSLVAGTKGAELVDKGMSQFNGKTWGETVSEITGYPRLVTEFTNPGALVGGGGGYKLTNSYLNGVENRAIEMAMKSTDDASPIRTITEGLEWMKKNPFHQLTRDRIKYLFTGKPGTGKYNNLQPESWWESPYNGEYRLNLPDGSPVDLAVGRSTTPHPSIGKLATDGDLGPLTSYVESHPNYRGRTKLVDVEQPKLSGENIDYDLQGDLPYMTEEQILSGQSISGNSSFRTSNGAQINTAGHTIQLRLNPTSGQPEYRRFDIWKFNPEEYWYKWLDRSIPPSKWNTATLAEKKGMLKPIVNQSWKNRFTDAGLRVVDSRITPYVYRTNWAPYPLDRYSPKPKGSFQGDPDMFFDITVEPPTPLIER